MQKIKDALSIIASIITIFGITISPSFISFNNPIFLSIFFFLISIFGLALGWLFKTKHYDHLERSDETISDLKEAPYEVKVNLAKAYINGYFIEEESEPYAFGFIPMGYTKTNENWYDEFCHKVSTREGFRYELKPKIRKIIKKNQDIIEDAKNDV